MKMLTHEQIETLNEILRNPKNLNVDSKVHNIIIKALIHKGYVTKSKSFRSTDGNIMFDYIVTEKGIEALENNFEL